MIYIDNTGSNIVVVTLAEKSTLPNPYYMWEIYDYDTYNKYYFTGDDYSVAPYNYNQFSFSVSVGATMGLTQGVIPANVGIYKYTVYQTATIYDIDPGNAIKEVETGIFNIVGTQASINTYTASDTNTIVTYIN